MFVINNTYKQVLSVCFVHLWAKVEKEQDETEFKSQLISHKKYDFRQAI